MGNGVRSGSVLLACLVTVSLCEEPVGAQGTEAASAGAWWFGVTLAAGVQPNGVLPICREEVSHSAIGALAVSAGRPAGSLHLEGRVSATKRADITCVGGAPVYDGVVTRSWQTATGGTHLFTSEARLRFGGVPDDPFTTAIGAGWAWGKSSPFVSWSVGTRAGGQVRWGVDAEVRSYFAPWRRQTASYFQGDLLEVMADERFRRAGLGFTLGVTIEMPSR